MNRLMYYALLPVLFALVGCELPNDPAGDKLGSISGVVLDLSTELPIAGAEVRALYNNVADTTDNQGTFFLAGLSVGSDTLRVIADNATQYTIITVGEGPQETTIRLNADSPQSNSFRSFHFRRHYFEEIVTTRLLVFTSSDEQDAFMDSTRRLNSYFPSFASYDDSMMVGMIYGDEVSISETFQIDSITITPYSNVMTVYSSLFEPIGKLDYYAKPSQFVLLPRVTVVSIIGETFFTKEPIKGEILFFRTYTQGHQQFISNLAKPQVIVLSSQQEESAFLDTTILFSHFEFPAFGYGDSSLVGVIMNEEFSNIPIQIVSLVNNQDSLIIVVQRLGGFGGVLPDPGYPSHFVATPAFVPTSALLKIEWVNNWMPQIE